MKKISKIVLENFRVYYGKREISFNNNNGKPADFVCIYGKNGFGKTSLFDGFEWFFTGEVYLLQKDLKYNVARYTGEILKNRNAFDAESAGVMIEYSDGTDGRRTIRKQSNSINDYNKGRPSGICKDIVNEKQILPHSKIDSFVYASKPTDMYDEWGNFWDPDNSQREHFKTIYNVYKTIENKKDKNNDKIQELMDEHAALNVTQKIDSYNKGIVEFNNLKIRGIGELKHLQFMNNEKIDMEIILEGEKFIEPLQNIITDNTHLSRECDYLERYFEKYKKFIQYKEEIRNRRARWEEILKKCNEKKSLLDMKERLLAQKTEYITYRDNIVNKFDEQWFFSYQKFMEDREKCVVLKEKIQSDNLSKQTLHDSIELSKDKNKGYAINLKNLSDVYDGWVQQIERLELRETSISSGTSLDCLKEMKEEADVKKEKEEQEQGYLQRAFRQNYEYFVQSLSEEELLRYPWIKTFLSKIQTVKKRLDNQIELEKAAKKQYEKMKEETEHLDELLTLIREEIQIKHINVCPVCKTPFDHMEELLNKIDLSEQQKVLHTYKLQWDDRKESVKKLSESFENECSGVKTEIEKMILEHEKSILELEEKSEKCRKEIKAKKDILQELQDDKEKLKLKISEAVNIEIPDTTKLTVKQAYESRVNEISIKMRESAESINLQQKRIEGVEEILEKNKLLLAESQKSKDEFYNNPANKIKLEILKQRKLSSYEDCLAVIKEYEVSIAEVENKISRIWNALQTYKMYKTKNIEKYLLQLNRLEVNEDDWVDEFEKYRYHVFKEKIISQKTIYRYNKVFKQKTELAEKKLNILNKYLSDLSMKDCVRKHNNLIEEVQKIQLEQKLNECKFKIAGEIFSSAQTQLEEHIKEVFGGTTISQIYEKIEPHKHFIHLKYQTGFNDDGKPELYLKVSGKKEEELIPELFFSSAQLNTVALSVFLGGALSAADPKLNTIFIDDPIGHFDDLNVLSFIDVLRTIVSETDWQIIISTHEQNFYELMKVKLDSRYYNSKFFVFKDEGNIVEDRG